MPTNRTRNNASTHFQSNLLLGDLKPNQNFTNQTAVGTMFHKPNYADSLSRSPPHYYANMSQAPASTTLLENLIKQKNSEVYRPLASTLKHSSA